MLDDLHFTGKTDRVKEMARRVMTELGPHASLALVTTSGTFGVVLRLSRGMIPL